MIHARHHWVFPEPIRLDPAFRAAARDMGLGSLAAAVLARRGVDDVAGLAAFLGPAEAGLHDPRLLPDAGAVVERVRSARSAGERIMVFGDFDADGLTGLAQLVLAFRRLGLDVLPYVPARLEEGHGLSMASVEAATAGGVSLIVTVDTGSTSVAEVAAAHERGIDVVITDHHHLPETWPAAVALVNPHRADSRYPDPALSGSGVAFTVARLLLGELADAEAEALELADLATIGTVSDVVPVLGENRAIARLGLNRMRTAPRPGIAALLERAGVSAASVDLETVGFVLAPRLNAAGRVGEALDAAMLLLASTPEHAAGLATTLEGANTTRRDLMRAGVAEARAALGLPDLAQAPGRQPLPGGEPQDADVVVGGGSDAAALIVRGPWSVGIIGLIAGRLADETGKAAIVGHPDRGRGPRILPRRRADQPRPRARRLRRPVHTARWPRRRRRVRAPPDRWDRFVARFLAIAEASRPDDARRPLPVDLALPAAYVDYGLYRDLARLAPCGPGNAVPLVAVLGLTVVRVREANGGHAQLVLRRELDVIDGIAFGRPDLARDLTEGDRVDVVARLASRTFGGLETLQLEVRDVAPSGSHPRAAAVLERAAGKVGGQSVGPGVPVPASGGPA